jgi:hypothetical protein
MSLFRTSLGRYLILLVFSIEGILGVTAYFSQGAYRTRLLIGMLVIIVLLAVVTIVWSIWSRRRA